MPDGRRSDLSRLRDAAAARPRRAARAPSRDRLRRLAPVAFGAAAMLLVVLLVGSVLPKPAPLTQQQVDEAIASALASVTPPPAYSQLVYQAVQPSLVLIQTDDGRGEPMARERRPATTVWAAASSSTSMATSSRACTSSMARRPSTLTFADGSTSPAEIVADPARERHRGRCARPTPPPNLVPATLGNPRAVRQGERGVRARLPFGLYGSVSAGVISGLDRAFTVPRDGRELHRPLPDRRRGQPGQQRRRRSSTATATSSASSPPSSTRPSDDVFIGIGFAVPIDVAGGAAGLPPY